MKYWRGYVVALILGAFTWALNRFCAAHTALVDIIYPYFTRLIGGYLADWSAGVGFCIWQLLLFLLVLLLIGGIVMVVLRKWNPIRWGGWVLAAISLIFLLHTGVYGLNRYAGTLAEDVRLNLTEYTVTELIDAATYYRDQANDLAAGVPREDGKAKYGDFNALAEKAAEGFEVMTYQESASVLSGSRVPVKKLGWTFLLGKTAGITVALTGEAAVSPKVPDVAKPWIICREMAHRMSIAGDSDANLAAYLTCLHNSQPEYRYAANLIAYHFCRAGLETVNTSTSQAALNTLSTGESGLVRQDLKDYEKFFGSEKKAMVTELCDQLVSWHLQYVVLPAHADDKPAFDPLDTNQVDVGDIIR